MRIDAVIFDCDGVLVDSEALCNRVLSEFFREHGVSVTPGQCAERFIGLNPRAVGEKVLREDGIDLRAALERDLSRRAIEAMRGGIEAVPGVAGSLGWLRERGVALAAASNSPGPELAFKLNATGLEGYFGRHIYSAYELGRAKPDPAVYLHAAAVLGKEPGRCVVIEDSMTGVRAGAAAGAIVLGFVGVSHGDRGVAAAGLVAAGAGMVFEDMRALPGLLGRV